MNSSAITSSITRSPAFRAADPRLATPANHHSDLVIEDLAELAAAGVAGVCGACIADYFAAGPSAQTIV